MDWEDYWANSARPSDDFFDTVERRKESELPVEDRASFGLMRCMLDTDTCVYLIKKTPGLRPRSAIHDCLVSGLWRANSSTEWPIPPGPAESKNQRALLDFISAVQVLPIDEQVAETYGPTARVFEEKTHRSQ